MHITFSNSANCPDSNSLSLSPSVTCSKSSSRLHMIHNYSQQLENTHRAQTAIEAHHQNVSKENSRGHGVISKAEIHYREIYTKALKSEKFLEPHHSKIWSTVPLAKANPHDNFMKTDPQLWCGNNKTTAAAALQPWINYKLPGMRERESIQPSFPLWSDYLTLHDDDWTMLLMLILLLLQAAMVMDWHMGNSGSILTETDISHLLRKEEQYSTKSQSPIVTSVPADGSLKY